MLEPLRLAVIVDLIDEGGRGGLLLAGGIEDQGELPEQQLVAMIAISTRAEGDDSVGNQISSVPVGWATDLDDPVERLLQIHRNAGKAKEFAKNYDSDLISGIGGAMPPALTNVMMSSMGDAVPLIANVLVSNVRGTPVPLYTAGARIDSMYPMSLLMDTQGLNVTAVSYMDSVDFGFTVDPQLVPEPWAIADRIAGAMQELVDASEEHPQVRSRKRNKAKSVDSKNSSKNREAASLRVA